jgi:CRISPR-associated protein Cas1
MTMQNLLNTLYVMTPNSYAHLENATVRIDVEREKKLQVPLHHLSSLVCFGNVMVSTALMHRLADEGKSLVLLDERGRFKARLEGPVSGNILLRQAQHRQASDPDFALRFSRNCLAGKLKNSRYVILRAAREAESTEDEKALGRAADDLAASLRALTVAADLETLRGIEGDAAKKYFAAMNLVIKAPRRSEFRFSGRTRRPPLDPINALLSFLYSMLMNDCRSALESVGLDPQLGFLHVVRPGRAALALDLMEELRPYLADRLALTLINRNQLASSDFDFREGGAVMLNERGRKAVVIAYQERKQEEVQHPLLDARVTIGLLPLLQARFVARTIRAEMTDYIPFLTR